MYPNECEALAELRFHHIGKHFTIRFLCVKYCKLLRQRYTGLLAECKDGDAQQIRIWSRCKGRIFIHSLLPILLFY
jgi:hypothetical protein